MRQVIVSDGGIGMTKSGVPGIMLKDQTGEVVLSCADVLGNA